LQPIQYPRLWFGKRQCINFTLYIFRTVVVYKRVYCPLIAPKFDLKKYSYLFRLQNSGLHQGATTFIYVYTFLRDLSIEMFKRNTTLLCDTSIVNDEMHIVMSPWYQIKVNAIILSSVLKLLYKQMVTGFSRNMWGELFLFFDCFHERIHFDIIVYKHYRIK